ncbi:MAG: hypothetical protein RLZZ607_1611 [Pseudomonadota bacterium]
MPRNSSTSSGTLPAAQNGAQDSVARLIALAFSAVWLGAAGLYAFAGWRTEGLLGWGLLALGAALPVILAWVLVGTIVAIRNLHAQTAALQRTIEGLRAAQSRAPVLRQSTDTPSTPETSLPFPQAQIAAALAPPAHHEPNAQPTLALGTEMIDLPAFVEVADVLRALHFPDGPDDAEGFRALRLALTDHGLAKLIRAAQDVLNLLAEDGIFVDALTADHPRPELWRKFAAGERGGIIAGLGGVRDRSSLALTAARMRGDDVFRDAAHHFLRSFDKAMVTLEPRASDSDLTILSDTRTARAFMLFGRVTGIFD